MFKVSEDDVLLEQRHGEVTSVEMSELLGNPVYPVTPYKYRVIQKE